MGTTRNSESEILMNQSIEINDIVRLAAGQTLIVTKIKHSRPANPYLGVLVGGQGKEYKFGPKHQPVKVGVAEPEHPALQALKLRQCGGPSHEYQVIVGQLCDAVEGDDLDKAKLLVGIVRSFV